MDREQTLHDYLHDQLDPAVIFAVDPPNAAGIQFTELDEWRVVACVPQLVAMSVALSDERFLEFMEALAFWCGAVSVFLLDGGEELEQAMHDAQVTTAEALPSGYAAMDAVFGLDL